MQEHTRALPDFLRQLFYVYYAFVGLCILAFGSFTFFFAGQIAAGEPVARACAGFLAVFWSLRLFVAAFIFDMKPYLSSVLFKIGYFFLNLIFLYILVIYVWAAVWPDAGSLP